MPGATFGGYPYAQPSDPLVQWPATSQQLAQKIDDEAAAALARSGQFIWAKTGQAWTDGAARFTFPENAPAWAPAGLVASPILSDPADLAADWFCLVQQTASPTEEVLVFLRCSDSNKALDKMISLVAIWM
jgi:hypothetical protein